MTNTRIAAGFLLAVALTAQTPKDAPMKINTCVETIKAYGKHVRFTTEEHLHVLLDERNANRSSELPYFRWEAAAGSIDWFTGAKPVSLAYVKSHMPRAMLLELQFPADPNPHAVQSDVNRLIDAERKYNESQEVAEAGREYIRMLMKKYGIGPDVVFDDDEGGATPVASCGKWEEREWPRK